MYRHTARCSGVARPRTGKASHSGHSASEVIAAAVLGAAPPTIAPTLTAAALDSIDLRAKPMLG